MSIRNKFGQFIGKGDKSGRWKGGKIISGYGYVMIFNPHYTTPSEKYLREHRLVMEKHLGRKLISTEIVHHINGVKTDNRIENLILTNRAEHAVTHKDNSPFKVGHKQFNTGRTHFKKGQTPWNKRK